MKFKNLALLLTVVLSIVMTGCSDNKKEESMALESNNSNVYFDNLNKHHETIPVPEKGWTIAELNKVFYVNGNNISIPFVLDDLGEDFAPNEEYWGFSSESNEGSGSILFNQEIVGSVSIRASNIKEVGQGHINIFAIGNFFEEVNCNSLIYINGITIGSSYDEILEAMGEPSDISDENTYLMYYQCDEYQLSFTIGKERVGEEQDRKERVVNVIRIEQEKLKT